MLDVKFHDAMEIRMDSPYNLCRIGMSGAWVPELPRTDWQDIMARRDDGVAIALVRWDTPSNQPGFRIFVIDCEASTFKTSERFPGCCAGLLWIGQNRIAWRTFPVLEGIYEIGATI